eukprot:3154896-Amphidinium_carterae.1
MFEKRQPEVSVEFAEFIATRVLTPQRVLQASGNIVPVTTLHEWDVSEWETLRAWKGIYVLDHKFLDVIGCRVCAMATNTVNLRCAWHRTLHETASLNNLAAHVASTWLSLLPNYKVDALTLQLSQACQRITMLESLKRSLWWFNTVVAMVPLE